MSTIQVDAIQNTSGQSEVSVTTLKADTIQNTSGASIIKVDTIQNASGASIIKVDTIQNASGASIIKVDTIQNTSGVEGFLCRTWVDYAPQTNTINASGGLGSITDNGVGDQTFNFSSAKTNQYYSYGGCGYDDSLGNADDGITTAGYATKTSSAIRMISGYRNTEYDYDNFSYFFGIT